MRSKPISLAIVQHGNQYLIGDGYANREGLSEIISGFKKLLNLHKVYKIPLNLHLGGTLIEAIAWQKPQFFDEIKEMIEDGLIKLIGGTYAENIMPLFNQDFNRRQIEEYFWLANYHLNYPLTKFRTFWVPERVWSTEKLALTINDNNLSNKGYKYVLLDDRLFFPIGNARDDFDKNGPWSNNHDIASSLKISPVKIVDGQGLIAIPISSTLRYSIPPYSDKEWNILKQCLSLRDLENHLLVYADDLEKSGGVGPWKSGLEAYEKFLQFLCSQKSIKAVFIDDWMEKNFTKTELNIDEGTYYELAKKWKADEDYRGWSESIHWLKYKNYLIEAEQEIKKAEKRAGDLNLIKMAWKHLMASTYETAWHDVGDSFQVAHWQRALVSHARSAIVIARASILLKSSKFEAFIEDIDHDEEDEVILQTNSLLAVIAPGFGGRIIYLFSISKEGGKLLIGNPTDFWNWQEELNRFMDEPPHHPGGLADCGHEHDIYKISDLRVKENRAFVEMENITTNSKLKGMKKNIYLNNSELYVYYQLPKGIDHLETDICFSPDYYNLLRKGQKGKKSRVPHGDIIHLKTNNL